MALYDVDTITELATFLGDAESEIVAALDPDESGSVMEQLVSARQLVYNEGTTLNSTEFDHIRQLAENIRLNETLITTLFQDGMSVAIGSLDNYFRQELGMGMRAYYDASDADHTVLWNDSFRSIWRREINQELIIKLGDAIKSAGTWTPVVTTPGIELPSKLELRTTSTIGVASISVTIGLTSELGDSVNSGISIPANTVNGTSFLITSGALTRFVDLTSLTVAGGTNADEFEIWVSV